MRATTDWLASTGAQFNPTGGRSGYAHLRNYSAHYCEWGDGPPLVLVPGLAGGFELLGPLASQLARHYHVISYQLRGEDDCFALRRRFGLSDLVDDLHEFLDGAAWKRRPCWACPSAASWPWSWRRGVLHRLSSLILQGSVPGSSTGLLQQVASIVLSRYPLPCDSPFVNQFFNLLFGGRREAGAAVRVRDASVLADRPECHGPPLPPRGGVRT